MYCAPQNFGSRTAYVERIATSNTFEVVCNYFKFTYVDTDCLIHTNIQLFCDAKNYFKKFHHETSFRPPITGHFRRKPSVGNGNTTQAYSYSVAACVVHRKCLFKRLASENLLLEKGEQFAGQWECIKMFKEEKSVRD